MNSMIKKAIILGCIGLVLGLIVGALMMILFSGGRFLSGGISTGYLIKHFIFSGLLGFVCNGMSVVYEIEEWSITRCTLVHFVFSMAAFYTAGFICEWFGLGDMVFWITTICVVAAYFMIWLVQFLRYRKQVRHLDREIKEYRERNRNQDE